MLAEVLLQKAVGVSSKKLCQTHTVAVRKANLWIISVSEDRTVVTCLVCYAVLHWKNCCCYVVLIKRKLEFSSWSKRIELRWRASDFRITDLSSKNMLWPTSTFMNGNQIGIQLLHSKCYSCTKPGCSGTTNSMRQSLTAFVEFNFSVMSQLHCTQAISTILSQHQNNPILEGLCQVLHRYASKFCV